MSEKDLIPSVSQSVAEPSTKTPTPGMTRIRFFRIWSHRPDNYDAILRAYKKAPEMPVIQIPRAAVGLGEKVDVVDYDIPSNEIKKAQEEPILRGDGIRTLRKSTHVVVVMPLNTPNLENTASHFPSGNTAPTSPFIRPLSDEELKRAA